MKSKIRFIATLTSLVTTLLVLVLVLPISIYAARQANVNGSGNLIYKQELSVNDQKTRLEESGFHTTSSLILQKMTDGLYGEIDTTNEVNRNKALNGFRQKAIDYNILSFKLYKKIDCSGEDKEIYQLEVVLDFSQFTLSSYAGSSIGYYNDIIWSKIVDSNNNLTPYTIKLNAINYYTGADTNENYDITFVSEDGTYGIVFSNSGSALQNFEYVFTYRVVLNTLPEKTDDMKNYGLRSGAFVFVEGYGILPSILTIDFSKTNIYADSSNNIYGFDFDGDQINLFNNNHLHFVGSNNNHYLAAILIADEYLKQLKNSNAEISIYGEQNEEHTILCKLYNDSGWKVRVIDSQEYTNGLVDSQRISITNMCFWLSKNNITDVTIYHQKVKANENGILYFDKENLLEVKYRESQTHSGWQEVYYVSNNEIIGYFNANEIDVNVTTN